MDDETEALLLKRCPGHDPRELSIYKKAQKQDRSSCEVLYPSQHGPLGPGCIRYTLTQRENARVEEED